MVSQVSTPKITGTPAESNFEVFKKSSVEGFDKLNTSKQGGV
jgi:hypothetical protein